MVNSELSRKLELQQNELDLVAALQGVSLDLFLRNKINAESITLKTFQIRFKAAPCAFLLR